MKDLQRVRERRAHRTRARIHGTAQRPRLSVNRSLRHIGAQVINDDLGITLCSASDRSFTEKKGKMERAQLVGAEIAKRAQQAGITEVVFDRGSAKYHGRVRALSQAAQEGGLKF